jgi:hypothetical protein
MTGGPLEGVLCLSLQDYIDHIIHGDAKPLGIFIGA